MEADLKYFVDYWALSVWMVVLVTLEMLYHQIKWVELAAVTSEQFQDVFHPFDMLWFSKTSRCQRSQQRLLNSPFHDSRVGLTTSCLFSLTLTWSALLLCWPSSRSWRLSGSWQMPQKIQLRSRFDCFSLSKSVPRILWSPMLPHPTRSFWSPCFLFIGRSRNDAPRGFHNGL